MTGFYQNNWLLEIRFFVDLELLLRSRISQILILI